MRRSSANHRREEFVYFVSRTLLMLALPHVRVPSARNSSLARVILAAIKIMLRSLTGETVLRGSPGCDL